VQPLTLREYYYEGKEGGRLILFPRDRYSAGFDAAKIAAVQVIVQPLTLREYQNEGIDYRGGKADTTVFPRDRYLADFKQQKYQLLCNPLL
jgi:hypothetical protein